MQVSYVPSAAHLSVRRFGSALPNLHSAIFAPVQFHKKKTKKKNITILTRNSPELSATNGKVTAMTFTC